MMIAPAIAIAAWVVAAVQSSTAAIAQTIVLDERQPLAMFIESAGGEEAPPFRSADVIHAASSAFRAHTDLLVIAAGEAREDDPLARCPAAERLGCLVASVRGTSSAKNPVRYVLAVSYYAEGGRARLASLLIDVDGAALEIARSDPKNKEALEAAIFEHAVSSAPFVEVARIQDLDHYFESLVTAGLKDMLERGGHVDSYGSIDIHAESNGISIELDGAAIGETKIGTTRIDKVLPGKRTLEFFDAPSKHSVEQKAATVRAHEVAEVSVALIARGDRSLVRPIAIAGGATVLALGAALAIVSLASHPSGELFDACVDPACREHRGFRSLCEVFKGDPSCLKGGKGILAAPLGYSMALAGGAALAGGLLSPDDDEPLWSLAIAIAIGLAAGAVAYGLSAAFDDAARGR